MSAFDRYAQIVDPRDTVYGSTRDMATTKAITSLWSVTSPALTSDDAFESDDDETGFDNDGEPTPLNFSGG